MKRFFLLVACAALCAVGAIAQTTVVPPQVPVPVPAAPAAPAAPVPGVSPQVQIVPPAAPGGSTAVRLQSSGFADPRTRIAVPPFFVTNAALAGSAKEMSDVINFDLQFSGLFTIITAAQYPAGFVGLPADVTQLNFDLWVPTGVENIVYGTLTQQGGQLVAQFRMFDMASRTQVLGQELRVDTAHPRLAAHKFSEEIIRHTDGTPGIGTSEIVFSVGVTGSKEIYVADYDGSNARQVTQHGSISIKPKISPDGQKIAYLSYKDRYSYLYIFDRRSGRSTSLSKEVGLNSAPSWSPDGSYLALTLSKDGNTEIYFRNPDGSNPRRITNNKFGDTSPSFSPDGSQLAFVSDRGGNPQIYAMDISGGNARRLSHQGGNSYDPVWSKDGLYIAYVAEKRGEGLEIYIMNADGSGARKLTNSGGANESPSWSADSRHVIFTSSRAGGPQLWAVNIRTGEEFKIPNMNHRAEGPSWGPRRQ